MGLISLQKFILFILDAKLKCLHPLNERQENVG